MNESKKHLEGILSESEFAALYGSGEPSSELERETWLYADRNGNIDARTLDHRLAEFLRGSDKFVQTGMDTYTHRELFVSGEIYEKLDEQRKRLLDAAPEEKEMYERNVKFLEDALPESRELSAIHMGASSSMAEQFKVTRSWLDGDENEISEEFSLREDFFRWARNVGPEANDMSSRWTIDWATANVSREELPPDLEWRDIVEYFDKVPVRAAATRNRGWRSESEEEILKAERRREAELRRMHRKDAADALFDRYIHEGLDPAERERLSDIWNRTFNGYVQPRWEKLPLTVGGMASSVRDKPFRLFPQQVKGVSRLTAKGNGLLAYDVGVGKTASGIVANMAQLRSGRCLRPLIIVPNQVYAKWREDVRLLFPGAKINDLYNFGETSISPYKTKGDPHSLDIPEGSVSLCTYEALQKISFTDESISGPLREDFARLLSADGDMDQRERAASEEKISAAIGTASAVKDGYVFFESCGFDNITVDEAHNFKNLWTVPKPENKGEANEYSGIPSGKPSARALKLYAMTQLVQSENEGRNVFLLTATPFTNSPLEVYSMLSYIGREKMKEMGITSLRKFMDEFAHTKLELGVNSKQEIAYKQVMKDWKNLAALQGLLTEFIDKVDGEEAEIIRPDKFTHVNKLNMTPVQKMIMAAEEGRMSTDEPAATLVAMNNMRLAAVSPALLDPSGYDFELPGMDEFVQSSPKMTFVCDSVAEIYSRDSSKGQFIYLPLGMEGHQAIKEYLVGKGIPENAIAIINGQVNSNADRKEKISREFNNPNTKLKIIIGGKNTCEGIDLNGNTVAMYNCSLGWNPSETVQAEGRIWRQGNLQGNVHVVYPLANDSIDAVLYQKHDEKRSRINELWTYKGDMLNVEDINPEELKFELIKDPEKRAGMILGERTKEIDARKGEVKLKIATVDDIVEGRVKVEKDIEYSRSSLDYYKEEASRISESGEKIPLHVSMSIRRESRNLAAFQRKKKLLDERLESITGTLDPEKVHGYIQELNDRMRVIEDERSRTVNELPKIIAQEKINFEASKILESPLEEQSSGIVAEIMGNLRPMDEVKNRIKTERFEKKIRNAVTAKAMSAWEGNVWIDKGWKAWEEEQRRRMEERGLSSVDGADNPNGPAIDAPEFVKPEKESSCTYYVRDLTDLELFREFDPVTGLSVVESLEKFKELASKGRDVGIGITVPGSLEHGTSLDGCGLSDFYSHGDDGICRVGARCGLGKDSGNESYVLAATELLREAKKFGLDFDVPEKFLSALDADEVETENNLEGIEIGMSVPENTKAVTPPETTTEVHTNNEIPLKEFIDSDMTFDEEDTILHNKVTGKYVWLYRETGGGVGKFEYDSSFNETSREPLSYAGMRAIVRGAILERNMDDWTILRDKRYFRPFQETEMSEEELEAFKRSAASDGRAGTEETELTPEDINLCRKVIPPAQLKFTMELAEGEEGEFFKNKMKEIAGTYRAINTDSELTNDDGTHNLGFRYFLGDTEIYISEIDTRGNGFGYTILNGDLEMSEFGYTSMDELLSVPGMEMDYHVPEGITVERMLYQKHPDYFAEYAPKEESVEHEKNAGSYTNEILGKIRAAGIEVVTDRDEFNRILEQEDVLQKMANDEIIRNPAQNDDVSMDIRNIICDSMKQSASKFVPVIYSRENYNKIFRDGYIESPIETVKLGQNQFIKLSPGNRNNLMLAIRQTIESPSIVLGKETFDENSESFKPVHVYGKSFVNESNEHVKTVESVIVYKEGDNVAISLHNKPVEDFIRQIKTPNDIVYLDDEVSRVAMFAAKSGDGHVLKETEQLLSRVRKMSYSSLGQESYPLNPNYNKANIMSMDDFISAHNIETGKLEINKDNFDRYFNILNQHKDFKDNRNKIASELFNYHVPSENKEEMKDWLADQGYAVNEKNVTQFMALNNGLTYGFVHGGKIYLNPEIMNSNAAVHEYTHLWDAYTRKTNPELWGKGLELFRDTKYWNEVVSDPNYLDIKDDESLVLSEIHARIQGDIAEQVLNRIAEIDGNEAKLDAIDWDQEVMEYISSSLDLPVELRNSEELKSFMAMPLKDLTAERNISAARVLSWNEIEALRKADMKLPSSELRWERTPLYSRQDDNGEYHAVYDGKKEYVTLEIKHGEFVTFTREPTADENGSGKYSLKLGGNPVDDLKGGTAEEIDKYILNYMHNAELNRPAELLKVYTFSPFGYEGTVVQVETDFRRGIPAYDIVGIADSAVKETRERIRAAFSNSGLDFPPERVLQSLSPADLRKDSPMDLSMALGILGQTKRYPVNEPVLALGELELSGRIRPVRGAVAAVNSAKAAGITNIVCDPTTAELLKDIDGIKILAAGSLKEANEKLRDAENFQKTEPKLYKAETVQFNEEWMEEDYREVLDNLPMDGHFETIRAIEIAVAGKHNILATGAPGCGKTLLTQTLMPALTPKMTKEESRQITRINSLAGLDSPKRDNLVPPFRMPHQTATVEGICGGGPNCRPGEISLAHQGTLFMDEAVEFRSSVIQLLRVPLESRQITLSRAGRSTSYPADLQLAMAMNPCPCGCYGSPDKVCLDSARSIELYWKKISDPLLDRVEIKTFVRRDEKDTRKMSIDELKAQIATAYEIQRKRGVYNSRMTPEEIQKYCKLDKEGQEYLDGEEEKLTPRGKSNLLKLSLTIANMDGREEIRINDLKEARELSAPVFEKPKQFVYNPQDMGDRAGEKITQRELDDVNVSGTRDNGKDFNLDTAERQTKAGMKKNREQCREILQRHDKGEILSASDIEILSRYEGGGGLDEDNRSSSAVLNEYYTPRNLVDAVWKIVDRYVPGGVTVLEPSAGVGRFADNRPGNVFTMHELDETSARINEILHPNATVIHGAYQKQFFDADGRVLKKNYAQPKYDIVIGNPPYGLYSGEWKGKGEGKEFGSSEEYFISKGLDALKDENSVLAYVVPSGFLDSVNDKAKRIIANKGKLLDAYRLPSGIFPTTDVGTDIILLQKWDAVEKELEEKFPNSSMSAKKELDSLKEMEAVNISEGGWFKSHPEKILGEVVEATNRWGNRTTKVVCHDGLTIQDELNKIYDAADKENFDGRSISEKESVQETRTLTFEDAIRSLDRKEFLEIYRHISEDEYDALAARVAELDKMKAVQKRTQPIEISIVTNKSYNMPNLSFSSKPTEEMRNEMKAAGWLYNPKENVWWPRTKEAQIHSAEFAENFKNRFEDIELPWDEKLSPGTEKRIDSGETFGTYSTNEGNVSKTNSGAAANMSDFDRELIEYINNPTAGNHIFNLGKPGAILQKCGFPEHQRIELSSSRLKQKSTQSNHPFELYDILGLDEALQNPVAVFEYGDRDKSQNVIVNLERDGKNFLVGVFFNQTREGFEVTSVRGLFNRDNIDWLRWIDQGKMIYGDKEKIQVLSAQQRTNLADVNSKEAGTSSDSYYLDSVDSLMQRFGDVKDIFTDGFEFYRENKERYQVYKRFDGYYTSMGTLGGHEMAREQSEEFYEALKNGDEETIERYTEDDGEFEISHLAREIVKERDSGKKAKSMTLREEADSLVHDIHKSIDTYRSFLREHSDTVDTSTQLNILDAVDNALSGKTISKNSIQRNEKQKPRKSDGIEY